MDGLQPRSANAYGCRVVDVSPIADEAEELLSLDVYNDVWPHDRVGLSEVHSFKNGVLEHVDLLARIDGAVAGSAVAAIQPQRPELVFALVTVRGEQRRRGAGTALYEAICEWTRERRLDTIEVVVADNDGESLAFAQRRGFVEDRRESGVALDLTRIEPPPVEPPEGVEIVTWAERPELARGMYDVALEALADIPGQHDDQPEPFEDWLAHDMQGPGDHPDATFVAVAGEEVVGWAKFSLTAAQPMTAHHDLTGVKRTWRGRGVARALKAAEIVWAKTNGYEELRTRNDERNGAIRHLNEQLGYRPTIGRIYLQRVSPPSGGGS
jgi:GNAT superfamily N-acetyltransferase